MKSTYAIGLALLLFLFSSCKPDVCENKDCGKFGDCFEVDKEAECRCQDGFEKDDEGKCEVFSISGFTGVWSLSDSCTNLSSPNDPPKTSTYEVTINQISFNQIEIINIGAENCKNGFLTVEAIIDENTFAIKSGSYCEDQTQFQDYFTVSGVGTISSAGIHMNYEISFTESGTVFRNEACYAALTR